MLLNCTRFIANNEVGDFLFLFFFNTLVGSCLQKRHFIKFWSLALPLYHPQVAMATAHIFEIAECESRGRLFPAGDTKDTVDLGEVVWGFSDTLANRTTLCFLFKSGGQNVDSRSDLLSNRIPGPDRWYDAIQIVIKC